MNTKDSYVNTTWGEMTEFEYKLKKKTIFSAVHALEKGTSVLVKQVEKNERTAYNYSIFSDIESMYYSNHPSEKGNLIAMRCDGNLDYIIVNKKFLLEI